MHACFHACGHGWMKAYIHGCMHVHILHTKFQRYLLCTPALYWLVLTLSFARQPMSDALGLTLAMIVVDTGKKRKARARKKMLAS